MPNVVPVKVLDLAHVDGQGVPTFTVEAPNGLQWRVTAKGARAQQFHTALADGSTVEMDIPTWALVRDDFTPGRKFQVVQDGAALSSLHRHWTMPLALGSVLVCDGIKPGPLGPCPQWFSVNGDPLREACELLPKKGGAADSLPADGYLLPL